MRTTVLRLERQIQEEHINALVQLQEVHDALVLHLLEAARQSGYLGSEPLAAVAHLAAPRPHEARIQVLARELWEAFFAGFRPDEREYEAARFAQEAGEITQRLDSDSLGGLPDADLAVAMLERLVGSWDERQAGLNERIDQLISELNDAQQRLGSVDLQVAYQEDESGRVASQLAAVLSEMGERIQPGQQLHELIARLVGRWRDELRLRSEELGDLRTRQRAAEQSQQQFVAALSKAAGGQGALQNEDTASLPPALRQLSNEIATLVSSVRAAETRERQLQTDLATQRAESTRLAEEVAQRDERLARYELMEASSDDEDRRLQLYRAAFAKLQHGEDASGELEAVRELERVLTPAPSEVDQAHRLLDSQLGELARVLGELRRLHAITDDPRRYRPRLLASSPYRLKTLSGVMQATRDAARDLQQYAAMARWAVGLNGLVTDFARLRRVFREMVTLVGECRDRLGGPPPASLTIPLDDATGVGALPAVLAVDLQALCRARGVAKLAAEIQGLLDEAVKMFHKVLERARGEVIQRVEVPKRESATKAVLRLADELLQLAGLMDQGFAEARANNWQLTGPEKALMDADRVLVLGLRAIDGACDVLAVLPGAPETGFTRPPSARTSGRVLLDRLLLGLGERVTWLEEIARFRIEPRG